MILQSEPVYMKSPQTPAQCLISEWSSQAFISCSCEEFKNGKTIVLPPVKPASLTLLIDCQENGIPIGGTNKLLQDILASLQRGSNFWEDQLLYDCSYSINEANSIQLDLSCRVWTSDKVATLLERPITLRPHVKDLPSIGFVDQVQICAEFCHIPDYKLTIKDVIPHFNEYLSSLIISQLEFQLPLVFSMMCRKRFLSQESDIGPISYALTNSSALLPLLVKLIAEDTTATTAYQLISPTKNRIKEIFFQIFRSMEDN